MLVNGCACGAGALVRAMNGLRVKRRRLQRAGLANAAAKLAKLSSIRSAYHLPNYVRNTVCIVQDVK